MESLQGEGDQQHEATLEQTVQGKKKRFQKQQEKLSYITKVI